MNRLLLTIGQKRCPYRCSYCFTDFTQYERPTTLESVEKCPGQLTGVDVIYPACDVDLFALKRWPELLARAADLGPAISLSTKAALGQGDVDALLAIDEQMRARGSVLKVGISFSTRTRCHELEPRAPRYRQRLESLQRLAGAGIFTALVLRPLLVDIAPSEYEAIVEDAAVFTPRILIGPEHLDDDEHHSRRHPRVPHQPPAQRVVSWAVDSPRWTSRDAIAQERAVRQAAWRRGLHLFESDLDLMASVIENASAGRAATG